MDTGAGVPDYHDYLPVPSFLIAHCDNYVSDNHQDHIRNHGNQSHLRFSDASVPFSQSGCNGITQWTSGKETNQSADQNSEVEEPDLGRGEVIGRGGEGLRLCQVQSQERRGGPRHDEAGKLHNREQEELPRQEQLHEEIALVWLSESPLSLRRLASSQEWIHMSVNVGESGVLNDS